MTALGKRSRGKRRTGVAGVGKFPSYLLFSHEVPLVTWRLGCFEHERRSFCFSSFFPLFIVSALIVGLLRSPATGRGLGPAERGSHYRKPASAPEVAAAASSDLEQWWGRQAWTE